MSVWVIVVAAGSGERFGSPKQYEMLGEARVLDHSLTTARTVADGVVLVVAPEHVDRPEAAADATVAGGATRSASVRAGLGAVPDDVEVVVVHDAARPLAPSTLFEAVVQEVRNGADAAIPVIDVADTLRRRDGGTVDRSRYVAVQTPQAFRASVLRAAHVPGADATDDAALVEAAGGKVVLVDGTPENLKITRPGDLVVAAALLAQ